jgi:NADP-dependent 3-hydroxy acid dehydrogenase YdfG
VAIGDVDAAAAEATAAELRGGVVAFELDVTDRDSFVRFLDEVERALGPLDVLVNNAGIMQLGAFVDEDPATTRRQVDINLHGVLTGTQLALQRFSARGRGHLVNIASTAGKAGIPGAATYVATKHAVVGLTEAVRQETRGTDIGYSIVMPGVVNTELATGLSRGRFIEVVEPEAVGAAIVDALKTGRVDVWVPSKLGPTARLLQVLPRPVSERIGRLLKADRVLWDHDGRQRAAYEDRAAHSEPGLEPGGDEAAAAAGQERLAV